MVHIDDILSTRWDAVVIGTGMGGATLGYALTKAGKRVLFCEKGRSTLDPGSALRGVYPEERCARDATLEARRERLADAGRCMDEWIDATARPRPFVPYIGNGTGGSTSLYGMAMERFSPSDFEGGAGDGDAPATPRWPITYEAMLPYYAAAERLFRVRPDPAPNRAPIPQAQVPPLGAVSAELFAFLQAKGMHPYRLPLACERVADCAMCQGYLCARECKIDAARACLAPALREHGGALLQGCEVVSLEVDADRVIGAACSVAGKTAVLRGDIFVLAAGALESPRILLRSVSPGWPDGLGNHSGLVGRNLMRHLVDLWVVFPGGRTNTAGKDLAFNDLCEVDGLKLGSVQSFGAMPPAAVLASGLLDDLRSGRWGPVAPVAQRLRPILERLLGTVFAGGVVLASIVEDFPYEHNRVLPPNGPVRAFQYRLGASERRRVEAMRRRLKAVLKPYRVMLLKQAENNQRLAHVCGSCRFGDDPGSSVLNGDNRVHGVANLYVVDASFFPSSGGTNPGLTIAANALRVADHLQMAAQ